MKSHKSAYSREEIRSIRKRALRIKGAIEVRHIFPRAYCIAKPAPGCAVFVTPWMDAEKQIRTPVYSGSHTVRNGAYQVNVGDWRSLAYVCTKTGGDIWMFEIEFELCN